MLLSHTNNLAEIKFFKMSYLADFKENIKERNVSSVIYYENKAHLSDLSTIKVNTMFFINKKIKEKYGFILNFYNYTQKSKECSLIEIYSLQTHSIISAYTLTQENKPFSNFKMIAQINGFKIAFDRIIKDISKGLV